MSTVYEGIKNRLRRAVGSTKFFFEAMKAQIPEHDRPDWGRFDFYQYCKQFDRYYNDDTGVKAAVLTIAGITTAEGIFVKPSKDNEHAKAVAKQVEEFNKRVHLKKLIYETSLRLAKYGTAFWELDWQSVNGLDIQLIYHQEYMQPVFDKMGNVTRWVFKVHGVERASWDLDSVCVFAWNVSEYPPFGKSLLTGIERELDIQSSILNALQKYMEKSAWASNIVSLTGEPRPTTAEIQDVESKVRNREPGEDFITAGGIENIVMGAAQIETRMVPDTLAYTNDRKTDALLVPTISKIWNSTEASAKELRAHCRSVVIQPMQELIAETVKEQIYQPFLVDRGESVTVVPDLEFEPPDKWISQMAEELSLVDLVGAGIVSTRTAAELLGLGEEYERDNMDEQNREKMMMQQQAQQAGDEGEGGDEGENERQTEEWIVRRRSGKRS